MSIEELLLVASGACSNFLFVVRTKLEMESKRLGANSSSLGNDKKTFKGQTNHTITVLSLTFSRYRGINVGWKKIQHHIGHFLVLVECISIAFSHEIKKFINQTFSN